MPQVPPRSLAADYVVPANVYLRNCLSGLPFFLVLVIGNIMSFLAERKNPPIENFIECAGVRLHYFERGDRAAACVVFIFASCTVTERPVSCAIWAGS